MEAALTILHREDQEEGRVARIRPPQALIIRHREDQKLQMTASNLVKARIVAILTKRPLKSKTNMPSRKYLKREEKSIKNRFRSVQKVILLNKTEEGWS